MESVQPIRISIERGGALDGWSEGIGPAWVRKNLLPLEDISDAQISYALDEVAHMTDRIQEEADLYMDQLETRVLERFDSELLVRTRGSTKDVPLRGFEEGTRFFSTAGSQGGWSFRLCLTSESCPDLTELQQHIDELTEQREKSFLALLR